MGTLFSLRPYINLPTRDYLTRTVLPRAAGTFSTSLRAALNFALNRSHGRIEEEDLLSAEVEYSHFALNSLLAENAGQIQKFEELLAQFSRSNEIVSELDLLSYMERARRSGSPQ